MAEFTFTDEQSQLRTAVRKFCAENFDEQTVRRLMESDPPFDPRCGRGSAPSSACSGCRCPRPTAASAARWSTRPSRSRSWVRRWRAGRCSARCTSRSPRWSPPRRARCATSCSPSWSRAAAPRRSPCADRAGAFDPDAVTVHRRRRRAHRAPSSGWSTRAPPTICWSPRRGADGSALYAVDASAAGRASAPRWSRST